MVSKVKEMMRFAIEPAAYPAQINKADFDEVALALFQEQYRENALYHDFVVALKKNPATIKQLTDIPFLPLAFFRTHQVKTGAWQPARFFESSGTTGQETSRHFVRDEALYQAVSLQGFKHFHGDPKRYAILALLPSYLERGNASLVAMARMLMEASGHPANGFFLDDQQALSERLARLEAAKQPTLLLGVTFALLDFAANFPQPLKHTIVIETGGMKGRREEWTQSQVHEFLKEKFSLPAVHTEYGMTELFSQAYAAADGLLTPAPTMRVLVRELTDPLAVAATGSGALNIIDLGNRDSCAFLATDDIGTVREDGNFEVSGRMDYAILRGCSLLTA